MLAVIVGVNSVIALFYYARVAAGDVHGGAGRRRPTPIRVPPSLAHRAGLTVARHRWSSACSPRPSPHFGDTSTSRSAGLVRTVRRGARRHAGRAEVAPGSQRRGPIPFDEVVELALYDPDDGFYASGGRGRPAAATS